MVEGASHWPQADQPETVPTPDDAVMTDYRAAAPDGAQIPLRWYAKRGSASGSAVLYTPGGPDVPATAAPARITDPAELPPAYTPRSGSWTSSATKTSPTLCAWAGPVSRWRSTCAPGCRTYSISSPPPATSPAGPSPTGPASWPPSDRHSPTGPARRAARALSLARRRRPHRAVARRRAAVRAGPRRLRCPVGCSRVTAVRCRLARPARRWSSARLPARGARRGGV